MCTVMVIVKLKIMKVDEKMPSISFIKEKVIY